MMVMLFEAWGVRALGVMPRWQAFKASRGLTSFGGRLGGRMIGFCQSYCIVPSSIASNESHLQNSFIHDYAVGRTPPT